MSQSRIKKPGWLIREEERLYPMSDNNYELSSKQVAKIISDHLIILVNQELKITNQISTNIGKTK